MPAGDRISMPDARVRNERASRPARRCVIFPATTKFRVAAGASANHPAALGLALAAELLLECVRVQMMRITVRHMLWAGVVALAASLAIATASAQTIALKRLMQQKLEHSQSILAAVTTSNWGEMQRHSEALVQVTRDPAWLVMNTPEYAKQSQAFVRAAEDLLDAARRRDLEAAPLAYVSMTLSCVQCHRYVARARIARQ
jgi:hypothetical protein